MNHQHPSWISISASALLNNLSFFKARAQKGTSVYPVIKSNAYGHGMNLTAAILEPFADGFCVHSVEEALKLETIRPVLVLGHISEDAGSLEQLLQRHDVRFTVCNSNQLAAIEAAARQTNTRAAVYVKLETGTHRLGLAPDDAHQLIARIRTRPEIRLGGVSTHFANIEDTTDHTFARRQLSQIQSFRASLDDAESLELHAACSAAALLFSDTHLDMIRLGISLYGYYSSRETLVSYRQLNTHPHNNLQPALSWRTRPIQVKTVPAGAYIGYGLTYRAPRHMRIAVLPVGYADGYDRGIAPAGHVLVHGQRAPIRGRICMNMLMVDVTDIESVTDRDTFTLLGTDGDETITAETLAGWSATIHYEVLARINPDIPRIRVP